MFFVIGVHSVGSLVTGAILLVAFMDLVFAPLLVSITPMALDVVNDHWLRDIIGLPLGFELFGELGLALLGPTGGLAFAVAIVGTSRVTFRESGTLSHWLQAPSLPDYITLHQQQN